MSSLNNAKWQTRKNASMARGEGNLASLFVEKALNAEVWDVEGKRYIDFGSGIAVCNTGIRTQRSLGPYMSRSTALPHLRYGHAL